MAYCTFQAVFQKLSAKVKTTKFETVTQHHYSVIGTIYTGSLLVQKTG